MDKINKWKLFGEFLLKRIKKPINHPEFIIYFLLIIVGFGSIGIFCSIFSEYSTYLT